MEVHHIGGTGAFMQVVNILCDDSCARNSLLQFGDSNVRGIGFGRKGILTASIVEIDAELRVAQPSLVRTYIFDAVMFP